MLSSKVHKHSSIRIYNRTDSHQGGIQEQTGLPISDSLSGPYRDVSGGPDPGHGHVLPLNLPSDDTLSEPSSKIEAECNPAYISIGIVDSALRRIP